MASDLFSCLVNSSAMNGETLNNPKSSEAYQYSHIDKVGCIFLKKVGQNFIKANMEFSWSLNDQVLVLVLSQKIQIASFSHVGRQREY